MSFPVSRPRRLRMNAAVRNLVREITLQMDDFILPLFIRANGESKPIKSMPGHRQLCLRDLPQELDEIVSLGLSSVLLFGIPPHKDELGSDSYADQGIIQRATRVIKKLHPELLVIADVCFCEYTSHGHCG